MINQIVRHARRIFKTAVAAKEVRNDFYFNRIYFKRLLLFFREMNRAKKDSTARLTEFDITPLGLKFGASVGSIKKQFGKPKYEYHNNQTLHAHEVLFYRQSYEGIGLLVQLQFYKNHLVFIGLDVVRRMLADQEKLDIVNTVIQKYLQEPYLQGDAYPVITDKNHHTIVVNDDVNFSICYLSGTLTHDLQRQVIAAMGNILQEQPEKGSLFYAF